MITKLIVKDYVLKRCPYLTKCELENKELVKRLKEVLNDKNSIQDILDMDKEETEFVPDEGDSEAAFNILDILKENPEFRDLVNKYQASQNKNDVEKLIEKYADEEIISDLVRKYFEILYGENRCVRCDVDSNKKPETNQTQIWENAERALKDPNIKVIFEGQIEANNYRARFDVLIKEGDDKYTLLEAKATNSVCTHPEKKPYVDCRIKNQYLYDLAFQYYVYKQHGLKFCDIGYITLNKKYQLNKLSYPVSDDELKNYFVIKKEINLESGDMPILDYIDNYEYAKTKRNPQDKIDDILDKIQEIESRDWMLPKKCYHCRKGPVCPFINHCFKDAFDHDSIFKLSNWNLYCGNYRNTEEALDKGYTKISDLPDDIVAKYPEINDTAKRSNAHAQIMMEKGEITNKYLLDQNQIKRVLDQYFSDSVDYLVFFDFESFQHPIPLVKDSTPYKQVVSQYSMHVVSKDYDLAKHNFDAGNGGGITHKEFIGRPDKDGYENPTVPLYETLLKQLKECGIEPMDTNYRVVVFNQNFEKTRMNDFVEDFTSKCSKTLIDFVKHFNNQVIDLLDFFTTGAIYSRDFMGRGSLKVVQPSLTSDKDVIAYYKSLKLPFDLEHSLDYHKGNTCLVYNGAICLDLYKSLLIRHHKGIQVDGIDVDKLLQEALAYCKIDSWGTVIIFDIIKNIYLNKICVDAKIV